LLPSLAVADGKWMVVWKCWQDDPAATATALAPSLSGVTTETDVSSLKRTGTTVRVRVRTTITTEPWHSSRVYLETFDCFHATHTTKLEGSKSSGPSLHVRLPVEQALYDLACG
jgi:hypothetical protein